MAKMYGIDVFSGEGKNITKVSSQATGERIFGIGYEPQSATTLYEDDKYVSPDREELLDSHLSGYFDPNDETVNIKEV